jgi:hypothetical protein
VAVGVGSGDSEGPQNSDLSVASSHAMAAGAYYDVHDDAEVPDADAAADEDVLDPFDPLALPESCPQNTQCSKCAAAGAVAGALSTSKDDDEVDGDVVPCCAASWTGHVRARRVARHHSGHRFYAHVHADQ